jgi:hypothetical protein
MEYVPLFLLFAAALIAGYFYLQRAKARDAGSKADTTQTDPATPPPPSDQA